ncbi:MAG: tetratricopeptide repeat protein [Planctomycetota bacterium]
MTLRSALVYPIVLGATVFLAPGGEPAASPAAVSPQDAPSPAAPAAAPQEPAPASSNDPAELMRQAQILMRNARVDQAIAVLERLVLIDPESARARLSLGRMYRAAGKVLQAQEQFVEVGTRDPYNVAAFCELSMLYSHAMQPEQALNVIEPVLIDNPLSSQAHVAKALALIKMQRTEEARQLLLDALQIDPMNHEAHYWVAKLALAEQNRPAAVHHLRRSLEIQNQVGLDPLYAVAACEELGELYLSIGRYAESIVMFDNVVPITKKPFSIHYNLGLAHGMMFHYDKAQQHLSEAIRIDPNNYLARIRYAYILEAQDLLEKAIEEYRIAGQIDPTQSFVHTRIGNILLQLGKRDEARTELEKGISLGAFDAQPFYFMGQALKEDGKFKEAVEYLEKGLELEPLHVESYYLLSQILPRTKVAEDRTKAAEYAKIYQALQPQKDKIAKYTSMLEISPSQVWTRIEMAQMLDEIGKTAAGMRYLNDALKIAPHHTEVWKVRAKMCLRLGMLAQARHDLAEARRLLAQRLLEYEAIKPRDAAVEEQITQVRQTLAEVDAIAIEVDKKAQEDQVPPPAGGAGANSGG